MVVTQREFYKAMEEINASFAALMARVEELEKKSKPAPKVDSKTTK